MAHQYYDRGSPHGIPDYDMRPPPGRRPPPPGNYYPEQQRRGPPPMRPARPGGPPPPQNYQQRPPQPQYAQPYAMESAESLYDGSAYGGAEDEADTWPLPARPFAQSGRPNSPGGSPRGSPRRPSPNQSSNSPRRPPQRPQRPDYQEAMLDPPRPSIAPAERSYRQPVPPPQQSHHGSGQWTGDGYRSQQPAHPPQQQDLRALPLPPTSQSQYQMPQALQQTIYAARNQRPPLGPPPSSRKGPPSYYPQIAPVHPIVEETDSMRGSIRNASVGAFDPAHSSYASSNAIPIGIPGYYVQDRGSARSLPYDQQQHVRGPSVDTWDDSPIDPIHEYPSDREYDSRGEPSPEPAALIRQASLGKKTKPTLTHVKSSERARREGAGQLRVQQQRAALAVPAEDKETYVGRRSVSSVSSEGDGNEKAMEAGGLAAATVAALAVPAKARLPPSDPRQRTPESVLGSGTGLLDASDSEGEKDLRKKPSRELLAAAMPKEQLNRSQPRSPLAPSDPLTDEILGSLQKSSGTLPLSTDPDLASPMPGLSSRPSQRRPPRLNVDAVRDAEARGSLTSLPDLIKRATKLASNLDRGRTASRLGMNFFVDGMEGDQRSVSDKRRSGSISDILNSFPPPSGVLGSPPGSRGGVSMSRWSSNLRHSQLPSDSEGDEITRRRKPKRRCCGMPLWLFITLLLVLFLLVAAAVLVPVVLLIIIPNNDSNSSSNGLTNKALQSCRAQLTCANGGVNTLSGDGYCRCVCTNGFTGSSCQTNSRAGCTTVSLSDATHATVGGEIPRLLRSAEANFSVPLDAETLLGLFSAADMSCGSENALVTFNNLASRSGTALGEEKRQTAPTTSGRTLDFARTAILYIFQLSSDASVAVAAQENFQSYFLSGETPRGKHESAGNVTLGNGYSCDLRALRLDTGNGTVVGVGI